MVFIRQLGSLGGMVAGAIGLSVVTTCWHWLLRSSLIDDPQYVAIYLFTFPMGALLGGTTGFASAALADPEANKTKTGNSCVICEWFGVAIVALIMLDILGQTSGQTSGQSSKPSDWYGAASALTPLLGIPLVWSICVIIFGIRLKKTP